jgi:hypothetical protein
MSDQVWYVARILLRCSAVVDDQPLFSEEFVLLKAASYAEAHHKAEVKGGSLGHSYLNGAGDEVRWTFQAVLEVKRTVDHAIGDGSEIYARTWSTPPEVIPQSPLDE